MTVMPWDTRMRKRYPTLAKLADILECDMQTLTEELNEYIANEQPEE